jgi:multiple sugar transport system permease protein
MKEFIRELKWSIRSKTHHIAVRLNDFLEKHHLRFFAHMPGWFKAIFFLLPALLVLGVFTFYPIINSFLVSFYSGYNIVTGEFDGYTLIGNYVTVLSESGFRQAILNTAIIVFVSVPIAIVTALFIAVAMNSIKPLKGFFQNMFFLPYVTNSIAIGLVFAFMFKGNTNDLFNLGLANQVVTWFGGTPVPWVGVGATYWSAMAVILIHGVWAGLAFKIIVFLSSIQGIDKQYYQAAQIDGASRSKSFRRITVPLISPMIFYILVTSIIGTFKTYSSIVAIIGTSGVITTGANGQVNLKTIVFFIYEYLQETGRNGALSEAAAAAILLFLIIMVFTVIQLRVGKKRVHY